MSEERCRRCGQPGGETWDSPMIHIRPSRLVTLFPDEFPDIASTGLTDEVWELAGGHAFVPPTEKPKESSP